MEKEIDDYFELITPFYMSFNLDNGYWYEDDIEEMPEPLADSIFVENLNIETIFGDDFSSLEEKEKDFNEYIAWIFGDNNCDDCTMFCYNFTEDITIAVGDSCIVDMLEFIEKLKHDENASIYVEQFSGVKLFAWQKADNKLRFVIQNYGNWQWKEFEIFYDVTVNKEDFLNQLQDGITRYITRIQTAVREYEIRHKTKLKNIQRPSYIYEILNYQY